MSSSKKNNLIWFLIPQIVAIAVLSQTIRLSLWQLDRAEEKAMVLEQWAQSDTVIPDAETIGSLIDRSSIQLNGRFDTARHILLDNQTRNNHPGVHVYSLFTPDNSAPPLLINRGWHPWLRTDNQWPEFETPGALITISGRLIPPPRPGLMLGEALPLDPDQWPNLMTYLDLDQIKAVIGDDLANRVVLLEPDHPAHLSGDPWPRVNMTPERHRGYAFQWAAISTAIFLLWIGLTIRHLIHRTRTSQKSQS